MRRCNKKGKGWKCSREAEMEHSFCSHHLAKHRAYLSSRSNGNSRQRTSEEAAAAAAADNDNNDEDEKGAEGVKQCSKRGKGWHCTRPAKKPHPFCDYHLTILRSYVSGRKPSSKTAYYWQGKRRGGGDVRVKGDEIANQQMMDCDDGKKDGDCNLEGEGEEIVYCRKADGRGWHCKRPAELPRSYCSHHLAQIREYSGSSSHSTAAIHDAGTESHSKRRKPRRKPAEAAAGGASSQSSFYYYYGGFGPWRGKARGLRVEPEQSEAPENEIGHVVHDDHKEGEEGSRETANREPPR